MKKNVTETPYAQFWIDEHQITCCQYHQKVHLSLEMAQDDVRWCSQINNGKKTLALVDITGVITIDRDARIFYASKEASRVYSAVGLIVNSMISRTIGNFFLGINKPQFPVKLFTSISDGIEWLFGFENV